LNSTKNKYEVFNGGWKGDCEATSSNISQTNVNHSPLTHHIAPPEHISRACEFLLKSSSGLEGASRLSDEEASSCSLLPRLKMASLPRHTRQHIIAKPEEMCQLRINKYPKKQNL
jgi:hypothetical protein